jgi:signal transduction histidine kinase/CheY-like chemotaxis protein/HPt (histidine-containing phosphotransfer) domain-containing protein
MHYSGMAAMHPAALLRYDPAWVGVSVLAAVVLAFISLSVGFGFLRLKSSNIPSTLIAAVIMGSAVAGMHYAAMRAALFFPAPAIGNLPMVFQPMAFAVIITICVVLIAGIGLVASFAGRQAELALNLKAEIAERERSEQELTKARHQAEEANHAKSQFLATMSHEIRTPLNGVIGMANLLASTSLDNRQSQLVDNLARSGRSLLALINDILDLSRIEAHELTLFEAPFEVRELVAEICDLFGEPCGSKGLDLIYSVAEDVPEQLLGDSVRLRQILINLVGNAVKFTEHGEVTLQVAFAKQEEDDALLLAFAVEDTGIGIAPDKLTQIFEPFRQADASMTRARGGSGLGLAITKHLVELQGGELQAKSEPGWGSRFQFTARFHRIANGTGPRTGRQVYRPLRTLLVDANATSARVTREYLTSWKIEAVVANTVAKAESVWDTAMTASGPFDVVIIDIKGLGGKGVEFAKKIRAEAEAAGGTEIILLVGLNDLVGADEIENLGAFAVLTKPARPSMLFDCFAAIASHADGKGIAELVTRRHNRAVVPRFEAHVLVVEDNPINQEVVQGILENMDCRVVTAANGRCAIERLGDATFDLILMDCEMPVMDGFEATRRIREMERGAELSRDAAATSRLPIVALTAHALAEIREECLVAGMDDFLVKPFDELQIGEMLRRWIPRCERKPQKKDASSTQPSAAPTKDPAAKSPAAETQGVIDLAAISKIRAIQGSSGSLFERVVSQFAETAPALAAKLRQECDAGDGEALWRTAHSLKSSAAALGAAQLSRRCAQIEALARESGSGPVGVLLDELEADVVAAQTGLQQLIGAEHVA